MNKWLYALLGLLVGVGLTVYWGHVLQRKSKSLVEVDESTFPLKRGDKGKEVAKFQAWANRELEASLPITGVMDESTMKVVEGRCKRKSISQAYYQKRNIQFVSI